VGEDPGRIAAGCVHQDCNRRGYFGLPKTRVKQDTVGPGFIFDFVSIISIFAIVSILSGEDKPNDQVRPEKKVIVPVTVHIPAPLREFSEGQSEVEIEGTPRTVADALTALWILFPGLRDRVATEQGEIRTHINIFVGDEDIRFTGGLATPLPAEAEISIVPSITGG